MNGPISKTTKAQLLQISLGLVGCEAIRSVMVYLRELEDLTFSKILDIIKRNLPPKKKFVIVERTKFLINKQVPNESIIQYVHKL